MWRESFKTKQLRAFGGNVCVVIITKALTIWSSFEWIRLGFKVISYDEADLL